MMITLDTIELTEKQARDFDSIQMGEFESEDYGTEQGTGIAESAIPQQVGTKVITVNGQQVTVRVFESLEQATRKKMLTSN